MNKLKIFLSLFIGAAVCFAIYSLASYSGNTDTFEINNSIGFWNNPSQQENRVIFKPYKESASYANSKSSNKPSSELASVTWGNSESSLDKVRQGYTSDEVKGGTFVYTSFSKRGEDYRNNSFSPFIASAGGAAKNNRQSEIRMNYALGVTSMKVVNKPAGISKLDFVNPGGGDDDFEDGAGGDDPDQYNDTPVGSGLILLILLAAVYVLRMRWSRLLSQL